MIRIKCPKCSTTLTLDDEEAGQVGECDDCGARFRVPARKAVPGRPGKETAPEQRQASRARDEEEDEEDNEESDEEEDEPRKSAKTSKAKAKGESSSQLKSLAVTFLVAIVTLGVGGIYIKLLAILVGGVSLLMMMVLGLMMAREAWSDGPGKFMMVWLIPLYLFYFVSENWKRTKDLFIPYVGFMLLLAVSFGGWYLQQERQVDHRKVIRSEIDQELQSAAPSVKSTP